MARYDDQIDMMALLQALAPLSRTLANADTDKALEIALQFYIALLNDKGNDIGEGGKGAGFGRRLRSRQLRLHGKRTYGFGNRLIAF